MRITSKSTILLTGGAGFVGRVLCRELLAAFPSSRRVLITRHTIAAIDGWEALALDISDFEAVNRAVESVKPDVVLHLAAQASVAHSQGLAEQTWRTNFLGTMALGAAVSRSVPTALFLYVSSGEVYGSRLRFGRVNERASPRPQNPYSSSKLAGERVLQDILSPENTLIVARPFNHTGAGQDRRFVLPSFAAQIAEAERGIREPTVLVGNLDAKRDFLHVNDVVSAYIKLINVSPKLARTTVVNVCSGDALPVRFYLDEMLKMASLHIEVVLDREKMRPSEIHRSCGDNSVLRSLTGWSPTITQHDLCTELVNYWRVQNA